MADLSRRNNEELPDTRMTIGEHLEELRTSLLRSIYGVALGFAICLYFGGHIFSFLSQPLLMAMQWAGLPPQLVVNSLPESFITYIKIALVSGIFLASPWVFYQLWGFVAAGLYPREKRFVYRMLLPSVILFLFGGVFFMVVVAPISCSFFVRFTKQFPMPDISANPVYRWLAPSMGEKVNTPGRQPEPDSSALKAVDSLLTLLVAKDVLDAPDADALRRQWQAGEQEAKPKPAETFVQPWFTLGKYMSLIVVLGLAFGLAFQMPLVVFFLGRTGIVELEAFRRWRKYVIFGIVIVAAILTPPDVISQVAMAIPMYLLYEIGVLALRIWPRPRTHTRQ